MKKKVHKLDYKPEFNFFVAGISSHENDYRLSWALNQHLCIKLTRAENVAVTTKLKEQQVFSLFTCTDPETLFTYNLVSNRCDNGFLVEEHRNIDFLLQVHGHISEILRNELIEKIKSIPVVNTAFEIDINLLKSKQKLLFWMGEYSPPQIILKTG